jgi:uncharacterized RDD family membrane protein YckC
MALLTISTPFNIDLEFSTAPFFKRMVAWVIDLGIIFAYSLLLMFVLYGEILKIPKWNEGDYEQTSLILEIFTVSIPVWCYHLFFELFMDGRSPGKMIMGLKVINKDGGSASLSQLMLRWLVSLPNYSLAAVIYAINPYYFFIIAIMLVVVALPDIICVAVSKHNQRLGDWAANTVVVDASYKADIAQTIYIPVENTTYVPQYPEVLKLSDRDINGIRNLLSTKASKDIDDYILRVSHRIEEVIGVKMNTDPYSFLAVLLKDYNYLTQHKN